MIIEEKRQILNKVFEVLIMKYGVPDAGPLDDLTRS
jgi:hypothetical protein